MVSVQNGMEDVVVLDKARKGRLTQLLTYSFSAAYKKNPITVSVYIHLGQAFYKIINTIKCSHSEQPNVKSKIELLLSRSRICH